MNVALALGRVNQACVKIIIQVVQQVRDAVDIVTYSRTSVYFLNNSRVLHRPNGRKRSM